MLRFVILKHTIGPRFDRTDQTHLDWMFEREGHGELLRTFATPVLDLCVLDIDAEATELAGHRAAYLDYQGPVSGDRGEVRRLVSGRYRMIANSEDRFEVELHWQEGSGVHSLHVAFYRSLGETDDRNDACDLWRLRSFRNETNR